MTSEPSTPAAGLHVVARLEFAIKACAPNVDLLKAALAEIQRLRSALPASVEPQITGETSDGYHTFNELYAYRKAFNALLFNEWSTRGLYGVHKSWRHSDGEECFGGGWFIVSAQTPAGQVTNHYKAEDFDLFRLPLRERAAEWDGHTPAVALQRLLDLARSSASAEGREQALKPCLCGTGPCIRPAELRSGYACVREVGLRALQEAGADLQENQDVRTLTERDHLFQPQHDGTTDRRMGEGGHEANCPALTFDGDYRPVVLDSRCLCRRRQHRPYIEAMNLPVAEAGAAPASATQAFHKYLGQICDRIIEMDGCNAHDWLVAVARTIRADLPASAPLVSPQGDK